MLRLIFVAFFSVALLNTQSIAASAKDIKAVDLTQDALVHEFNPTPNPEPSGTGASGSR